MVPLPGHEPKPLLIPLVCVSRLATRKMDFVRPHHCRKSQLNLKLGCEKQIRFPFSKVDHDDSPSLSQVQTPTKIKIKEFSFSGPDIHECLYGGIAFLDAEDGLLEPDGKPQRVGIDVGGVQRLTS